MKILHTRQFNNVLTALDLACVELRIKAISKGVAFILR